MSPRRLLLFVIVTTALLLAYNHSFTNEMLIITHQALAQVPPIPTPPSLPGAGEETLAGNQLPNTDNSQTQLPQSATPTNIPPTIQITSHQDGSQVPVGELTIQGTSSDNQESSCQVYADVNDIAPLQNATAAGANGADDYSQWTFTYSEDYQLITQGVNELTAKISCFDNGAAAIPLSEWHSVNVTGVVGGGATPTPTLTQTPATTGEALGAEQGANIVPSPTTSLPAPSVTAIEPSGGSSQSGGEGGNGEEDDDDDGDDENGDDDGDDDDSVEEDDG